ncbi:MAG TPA: GxxExxY protein [Cytophagaceae bacterium]|jgi:GxxExxY protein|nr:GxxExxY protein [Cytophagaceae bacterium]
MQAIETLTHAVIGCAMKVHSTLGNGFQEVIYQRALAIELEKNIISFQREVEMKVFYDNIEIGSRRVDFYINDEITVELKALTSIQEVHLAQAKNYLEAFKVKTGLLINFGSKSLEFKRLYNNKIF